MRLSFDSSPKIGNLLSNQTADVDARYYGRIGANGLLALRARGYKSWGAAPNYFFFGGNSEMRGYDYRQFLGHKGFFANAELRFPLIEAMLTPLGILGGIRGVFFANLGGAALEQGCSLGVPQEPGCTNFKLYDTGTSIFPVHNLQGALVGQRAISGFRLVDSRASYGIGLETFALGFPVHFDWSYRTLLNKGWEDYIMGSSAAFRKPKFAVWIGYDF